MSVFEGFCAFYKNSFVCQIGENKASITVSVLAMSFFYSTEKMDGEEKQKMNSF